MMNWSSEVIVYIIATIIMGIALGMIFSLYRTHKNRFLTYFLLVNLISFVFILAGVFNYLFLSILISQIRWILLFPLGIFMILTVDYLRRFTVDPLKIFIFGITIGGSLFFILDTNNFMPSTLNSGEPTLINSIGLQLWGIVLIVEIVFLLFYYTILIYKFAKGEIKVKARLTVLGGGIYAISILIFYSLRLYGVIPGAIGVITALGFFLINLSFKREPRLINVLIEAFNMAQVKIVKKFLPICAHCKNIRNEDGLWYPIESFFHEMSNLDFSHTICPSCIDIHYSDFK
jgi:hypothetical protein